MLGKQLERLRTRAGLSRSELAGAIKSHPISVWKWETDNAVITLGKLVEFLLAVGAEFKDLHMPTMPRRPRRVPGARGRK